MRIAVASDDGTSLAAHTGRCQGFVIFDVKDQRATRREFRTNTFTGHAQGKCGHEHAPGADHAHQSHGPLVEALNDCTALLARGMGPRLRNDLAARGIDAFLTPEQQVDEAARRFAAGNLARASHGGACPQG